MRRKTDGNHILYHYLQKELLTSDVWLFQMLAARLVTGLGIWIHPDTYSAMEAEILAAAAFPALEIFRTAFFFGAG